MGRLTGSVPADFDARFARRSGGMPAPGAEDGYRAMAGVLRAIDDAGAAGNDRQAVVDAYL